MAKDARIPMRVPEALKEEFQWASEQDGCRGISTWLRQLGEERADQLRRKTGPLTETERENLVVNGEVLDAIEATLPVRELSLAEIKKMYGRNESDGAFIPGFGLDEEA